LDKPSGAAFSNPSASELARDSENTSLTRCAGDPASASSEHSVILKNVGVNSDGAAGAAAPATSYSPPVTPKAPPSDWAYALKDVSFEVKRGELRTLGRSEKEISKKCLGATKVPDSGRRRYQLLGIIGRNGAARKARGRQDYRTAGRRTGGMTPVNQAAGRPLGPRQPGGCTGRRERLPKGSSEGGARWEPCESNCRKAARRVRRVGTSESTLPEAAHRVRRRGKARINSTLLKILSRVTTQTEGRIARVRAGDRSWKVADRCNQAAGRPRGPRQRGPLLGNRGAGVRRERLPKGSSEGGARWEPCESNCRKVARRVRRVGTSESTLPQGSPRGEMSGSERINGQIASLLEVGTGFGRHDLATA
jgi:hypothetical protein